MIEQLSLKLHIIFRCASLTQLQQTASNTSILGTEYEGGVNSFDSFSDPSPSPQ